MDIINGECFDREKITITKVVEKVVIEDHIYRDKLLAFMDGLGLNSIWEASQLSSSDLYQLGNIMKTSNQVNLGG